MKKDLTYLKRSLSEKYQRREDAQVEELLVKELDREVGH